MFNIKIFNTYLLLVILFLYSSFNLFSQDRINIPSYILKMEEIAQGGNSDVQYNLGLIYSNGEDVEKDLSKAIFWFKKSASQDNILAQYKLGYIYDNGLGVKKDPTKAYQYYLSAGEKGNADAQLSLIHI